MAEEKQEENTLLRKVDTIKSQCLKWKLEIKLCRHMSVLFK